MNLKSLTAGFPAARNARFAAGVFVFALAVLLQGCAALIPQSSALRDARPAGIPERIELSEVPFFPQTEYQCGPAALATVLAHGKAAVTPEALVSQVYVPERKGSLQVEMLAAARRHGMVSYVLLPRMEDMLREIAAGNPVIVLQDLGIWPITEQWHYAVAVGYDLVEGELILRSGERKRQVLPLGVHEYVWRRSDYWAMVAVPPGRIPATADEATWLAAVAAFERVDARGARTAYAALRDRWPGNVEAMIGLANAHHAAGDLKGAEAALRGALARRPDSVVVLNNLAQTLSDQGRHAEALPFAERAAASGGPFAAAARQTRDLVRARMARKP